MKLSIVTLNYNSSGHTIELLRSLAIQTDKEFDVFVLDNASQNVDELEHFVTDTGFNFIQNGANLGFAGGSDPGIKKAFEKGADWVLILNPDTQVGPDFISELKKNIAGKSGLIGLPLNEGMRTVYGGRISWLKPTLEHFEKPDGNAYVIGGALCVSKEAYEKIGPLNEKYFLYFEDAEYSLKARLAGLKVEYLKEPIIRHQVSAVTSKLGSPLLLRYHFRNALYFNRQNGPWWTKVLIWPWSWYLLAKEAFKILIGHEPDISEAIISGVKDFYDGRMGRIESPKIKKIRIGIECESIEGKNHQWGIGRIIMNLLKEISERPELAEKYQFVLYFKDRVPDFSFLSSPIFLKKTVPVPFFSGRLFPFYYYLFLPIKIWSESLDLMFWPNYMLPLIASGKNFVILTEDVYYEAHGKLPLRYRLAYSIFGGWTARSADKILAISETSKKELGKVYDIAPHRIIVDQLGVEVSSDAPAHEGNYLLAVGQGFPRRHFREILLAFERIAPEQPELKLILIGPDKYEQPTIAPLLVKINKNLGREAVIHHEYVSEEELVGYYKGARGVLYISDREAFGLPPMEAWRFGAPAILNDTAISHELFGEHAFLAKTADAEGVAAAMKELLTDTTKVQAIKEAGPEILAKYTWKKFCDRWLE
ncbi:MAG TPA: glycosyltransferase, partial [Candidatus Paceibacterota bacterium]|nr:glycosyltransferase [Candidatus Paceibacterota bacterium]